MVYENPNRLIVEDTDLHGVVIALMQRHLNWGEREEEWPVFVQGKGGKNAVFDERIFNVELKASGAKRVGIVVDADSGAASTWDQVATFCRKLGGSPPNECPERGFIINLPEQKFGAWIMPDNRAQGMVEDFCHMLVPKNAESLWQFALKCADEAKAKHGAPFPDNYRAKAHIHTWLAWQNTPGERMGAAITGRVLGHSSEAARAFAEWFIDLFEVSDRRRK